MTINTMTPNLTQSNAALLMGRILLAAIFVLGGWGKLMNPAGAAGYIQSVGLPGFLIYPAILAELGGGLLILVGYQTRLVAMFMMLFTLFLGAMFHNHFADQMQMINFMKNLGIAGGFLSLFVSGAGAWSVDGARGIE